jgi:hypothetical protein
MHLADFCNPHFKDEHPSCAWIPELITPDDRASSRHPVRFARPPPETMAAVHHHGPRGAKALTPLSPEESVMLGIETHRAETDSTSNP